VSAILSKHSKLYDSFFWLQFNNVVGSQCTLGAKMIETDTVFTTIEGLWWALPKHLTQFKLMNLC
jgi:hypothetical protein